MDIHEYQAKDILSNFGVTKPRGGIVIVLRPLKIKQEKLVDQNGLLKHKFTQVLEEKQEE